MAKKIQHSKQYGAICILDALGTKGIWKQKNPQEVIANWEYFVNVLDDHFSDARKNGFVFNLYAFSDTLILTCSGKHPIEKLLYELGVHVLSATLFGLPRSIFLRGCMSIGNFYESNKMILGPAIDEAAQYYEHANWIGVHLTPSAFSVVDRFFDSDYVVLKSRFYPYSVPVKNGKSLETYALVFQDVDLHHFFGHLKGVSLRKEEQTLIQFIHYRLEHLADVEGADKWKNTLDFVKLVTAHFKRPLKPADKQSQN